MIQMIRLLETGLATRMYVILPGLWITEMTDGLLLLMKKISRFSLPVGDVGTLCAGLNRSAHARLLYSYLYDPAVLMYFFLAFTGQDTVHGGFTRVREFLGYLPNCLKHRDPHISWLQLIWG